MVWLVFGWFRILAITSLSYDPVIKCLAKNRVERMYSCFALKSDVCSLQSQHQNHTAKNDKQKKKMFTPVAECG